MLVHVSSAVATWTAPSAYRKFAATATNRTIKSQQSAEPLVSFLCCHSVMGREGHGCCTIKS